MDPLSPTTSALRRSFTTPVSKQPSSPDPQIETLYSLPFARIVAFTSSNILPTPRSRPGSSNGSPAGEYEVGTLSWVSRFERTIAVGALRIYRAPGSVAFLNCANALKPILPKSQCWCVDGDSKFVVQIKPPQYWRIELPNKTAEEVLKVEELKKVFEQVLRFEKTPCPFQRNFTVDLPPETPVKWKPWTPMERPSIDPTSFAEERNPNLRTPTRGSSCSPNWDFGGSKSRSYSPMSAFGEDTGSVIWSEPETQSEESSTENTAFEEAESGQNFEQQIPQEVARNSILEPSMIGSNILDSTFGIFTDVDDQSETYSDTTEHSDLTLRNNTQAGFQPLMNEVGKDDRPQVLQRCSRSVTAPPVLSITTSPPSGHRARSRSPLRCLTNVESNSEFSSSVESFHSVQSWHNPSPSGSGESSPSSTYPYPHREIVLPKRPLHSRDVAEIVMSPETPRAMDKIATTSEAEFIPRNASPPSRTPTVTADGTEKSDEEQSEVTTPTAVKPMIRHRATTSSNSRRRALSPLPPAVNLFSPPRERSQRLRTARHIPTAIIRTTWDILLSPPSYLFHLMIRIASKIAAGEWRGVLSGHGEAVHWDFEDEYGENGLFEDDYGISISKPSNRSKPISSNATGGSWEVD